MSERGVWKLNEETGELVQLQDGRGWEVPDPTPVAIPVTGVKKPLPLAEQVARLVRSETWNRALADGAETFAEADDFDVEDDFDPRTPYETEFDPTLGREVTPADFQNPERRDELRQAYLVAERNAIRAEERQRAIDEAYRRKFGRPGQRPGDGAEPRGEPQKGA
jgi:hypothetical protein